MPPRLLLLTALAATLPLGGCSWWFFSDTPVVDRSRPVALIETTGGVELGATTELGILTLGRSAVDGPCRVHYFLGPSPLIEDGELTPAGSVFTLADIDLRHQHIRVYDQDITAESPLVAMWTPDGRTTQRVAVKLADAAAIEGDLLRDPGQVLPPGAAILTEQEGEYRFVGLVSARATLRTSQGNETFYTFAGLDRVRELLATPEVFPKDYRVKFRPDDISVRKPVR